MSFLMRKQFVLVMILFAGSMLAGCSWIMPENVEVTGAKSDNKKPMAPVVVDGTRTSYADIVEKSSPAVVQITATFKRTETSTGGFELRPQLPGPRLPAQGAGSGVLVSEDGTILTNHHVIKDADKITVENSDSKVYDAEVVGSDEPSDLAVIRIKGEKFPFLKLGDSDSVRIGDIVLAIGNPLGIGQTVTSGIISAKGRRTGIGDGAFQDFLQTDAPINQGNSGGALVNVNGELIGINSQILSQFGGSIGIGFAIPSNMAKSVMDQLIKSGKVRRGMLGVNIQDVNEEIAKQFGLASPEGVIVSNVNETGAAAKAGVKRGDIITKLNGEKVEDGNFLRNKVAGTMPGTEVSLTIFRDKKEQEIKVTLDEFDLKLLPGGRNDEGGMDRTEPKQNGKLGVSVQPLTPDIASRFKVPAGVKGVVVTSVDPQGPAALTGIRPGDVIMEVNRQIVESIDDMRAAIDKSGSGGVLLLINRQGQTVFLTVRP